ncbi:TetR/AcrR family transcriptional regulator [Rhizobium sp. LC145]|uniref:TetR/AcrR family transcriptional regulator n=1 Tax=Rhizobium sp. LC145 TaxID=1120688 RepID=UPI00062A1E93|nr:TetR/AcrR family transcriptional regulator [Rhizobium sp. LC145]KKX29317.1 TetR family transcriptional regulator [Rhizobium sp. LC145]TKT68927.1 TetR/AcrR family transcriptional regulator [Rhizobiaceae bacterium LC148]
MAKTDTDTRERIVATAAKLFYMSGVRAVSMDAIAEKADLTKRTLYYHFRSKDDLIAAYLEERDHPNLALFQRWYEESPGTVADKVESLFRNLAQTARHTKWRGCGFLRTVAELADMPGHPAVKAATVHKKRVEDWLAETLEGPIPHADSKILAQQVMLLMDGAFAAALTHRDPRYMETAGKAASTLIRAAQAGSSAA